ncbi:MAG: MinD/ParA family protein [candidate division KSB1 bacterium]|nr:MinD/ParA family protein [candidate division KSB1 bacterium]MDZ7385306.1 MinD/ParA family protein [candidate division KSB1 bacterium]MDZ7393394.1 MinD/ParA family protein [candidate division KSB1 bacterium]
MQRDQLETVREIVRRSKEATCRLVAVASGKGGVGKTNIALNLGIALAEQGQRVLVVDADHNLANVDLLLGVTLPTTLRDVLCGAKSLDEAIHEHECGVRILPGSSGLSDFYAGQPSLARWLVEGLGPWRHRLDHILMDTAAGLTVEIVEVVASADEVLVVTTPEPPAINDAYALVKVLHRARPELPMHLVLNMVESAQEAYEVWERFSLVVRHFLQREIPLAGHIVGDWSVPNAVKRQRPLILEYPSAPAAECIRALAVRLARSAGGPPRCDT